MFPSITRPFWAVAAAVAMLLGVAPAAQAQGDAAYPVRAVRILVPFPPSGGADLLVRMLAQELEKRFRQPVVVENRAGAGGNIATAAGAKAEPDGYTLLMANISPMAINVSLYKDLPYNPAADFQPVSLLANFPSVLLVRPQLGVRSIPELVALAKSQPGQLTFASSGHGSLTQLGMEFLKARAGIDMVHVPFTGAGPATTAVLGGTVDMYLSSLPAAIPYIAQKTLVALGVSGPQRSPSAPDIPTIAEQGFPGFEAVTWIGIVAPARTPRPVVETLNKAIVEVMHRPDIKERLDKIGAEAVTSTPEAFAAYIKSEIAKWAEIIRVSNIKAPG